MSRFADQFWKAPNRLSPTYAKGLTALSLFVLLLAALGLFTYDGLQRVAYVSAMGSIALGNLAWGVGSLLPEEPRGRKLRAAARPFFLVMLVTLPIATVMALRP